MNFYWTWVGEHHDYTVISCLDRVLTNLEWLATFPASEEKFLWLYGSDHRSDHRSVITTIAFANETHKKIISVRQTPTAKSGLQTICCWRLELNEHAATFYYSRPEQRMSKITLSAVETRNSIRQKKWKIFKAELDLAQSNNGTTRENFLLLRKSLAQVYRD